MMKPWNFNNRIAFCIHEIEHFCRLHVPRRIALLGTSAPQDKMEIANIAFDMEINPNIKGKPQKDFMFPETFKLPKDKTAEWYYYELLKIQEEQKQQQSGGSKGGESNEQNQEKMNKNNLILNKTRMKMNKNRVKMNSRLKEVKTLKEGLIYHNQVKVLIFTSHGLK